MIKLNRILQGNVTPDKDTTCIYKLYSEDSTVVYVGQTKALERRLYEHISNGIEFVCFSFEVCCDSDANDIEAYEIVSNNSKLNKSIPTSNKYPALSIYNLEIRKAINNKMKELLNSLNLSPLIVFSRESHKHKRDNVCRDNLDSQIKIINDIKFVKLGEE